MASYLVRSGRVMQASKIQKHFLNRINHSKYTSKLLPYLGASVRTTNLTIPNQEENTRLNFEIHHQVYRSYHSSVSLMKKFKESQYERLRIFDPSGQFLCIAELYVLMKFCHQFHRYKFQEMESAVKDQSANANDEINLRTFQIVDKRKLSESPESTEKKTKLIRFHKDATAGQKLPKILEILVDRGKINISFAKKGTPVEAQVKQALQQMSSTFMSVPADEGDILFAKMNDIDSKVLLRLFEVIQSQEADHIAKVREMLDAVKGQ